MYNHFVKLIARGFLSRNDMNYALTELKEEEPWLRNYHSKMLQMISTRLAGSEKALEQMKKKGLAHATAGTAGSYACRDLR